MLVFRMSQFFDFSWSDRRTWVLIGLVLILPLTLIGLARLFATDMPKLETLELARAVLEEHVGRNPPNRTWKLTATRITDKGKLEMDVDVDNYDQAEFILSRKGRIRYNYLKQACPVESADVYSMLAQGETVWLRLHYNGKPIVDGPCPLSHPDL